MSSYAQSSVQSPERAQLERKAAAVLELRRRQNLAINAEKTVYGIYRATGEYGGELIKCLQEQNGVYVEVDKYPVVKVPEKLEPLLVKQKRFKIAFGGRSGGKSNTFGDIFAGKAKDYGDKTMCLRELQNSIDDSVHALLKSEIERLQFTKFDVTQSAIRLDGEDVFKFKGLSRNPDAVKSMFGFKRAWGEEAQAFSEESLRMLTPTIREKDSELWFSLNRGGSGDPFEKRFLAPFMNDLLNNGYYEDDLHLIVWINYCDNPWHSDELESERIWDKQNLSTAAYNHIWLGHPNDEVENSLIMAEWFDACIDAHKKLGFEPTGAKYAAHDPSDLGPDSKSYAARHGSVVYDIQTKTDGTANDGARWACDLAIQQQVDHYTWDGDGLGAPLREQIAKSFNGKLTNVAMFRGSEAPDYPDAVFEPTDKHEVHGTLLVKNAVRNKRAQYYAELRRRVYNTWRAVDHGEYHDPDDLLSFDSSIPILNQVRSQVCRLPIKPNGNGKIELYTKAEMKQKFKMDSPNESDAVMMLMRSVIEVQETVQMPRPIRPMGR